MENFGESISNAGAFCCFSMKEDNTHHLVYRGRMDFAEKGPQHFFLPWLLLVYLSWYDTLTKYLFQQVGYTMRCLYGCDHQQIGVHVSKVDIISGITHKLRQKQTLRPAIAFAERMKCIGDAIKICDFLSKFIARQTFEIVTLLEPLKNQFGLMLNICSRCKLCSFLADINGADLAAQSYKSENKKQ